MSRRYRVNKFRVLKKYLDQELLHYGVNPGETKRQAILAGFSTWHDRKHLNRYIDRFIKDPDTPIENGGHQHGSLFFS